MSVRALTEAWAFIEKGKCDTAGEKLCLLRLADHVNDETKQAWPSTRHLAKMTGLGRSTVQRSLLSLADKKAFKPERRKSQFGDDKSTLYHWLLDGWDQNDPTKPKQKKLGSSERHGGAHNEASLAPPSSQGDGPTQPPEPPSSEPSSNHHPNQSEGGGDGKAGLSLLLESIPREERESVSVAYMAVANEQQRKLLADELLAGIRQAKVRDVLKMFECLCRKAEKGALTAGWSRDEQSQDLYSDLNHQISELFSACKNGMNIMADGHAIKVIASGMGEYHAQYSDGREIPMRRLLVTSNKVEVV